MSFLWAFLLSQSSKLYVSASLEFTSGFAALQDTGESLGENRERLMVQQFYISTSGNKQAGEGQLLLLLGATLPLWQAAADSASLCRTGQEREAEASVLIVSLSLSSLNNN